MAVTQIKYLEASETGERSGGGIFKLKYKALVWTNNAADNATIVLADPRLPLEGAPFQLGTEAGPTGALCERVHATRKGPKKWLVDIEFVTPSPGTGGPGEPGDPGEPPELPSIEIYLSSQKRDYFSAFDADGKKIVNTLGQRFAKPPPQVEYDRVIQVVGYQNWHNEDQIAQQLLGRCNSQPYLGYASDTLKFDDCQIRTTKLKIAKTTYYVLQATYIFLAKYTLWRPTQIANEGSLCRAVDQYGNPLNNADGTPMVAATVDDQGTKHGKSQLLSEAGIPLKPSQEPFMLSFNFVKQADFMILPLPPGLNITGRIIPRTE